jgi:DNA end-binding protein Ku
LHKRFLLRTILGKLRSAKMARNVWRGYISFGLISVPVRLFVAARYSHICFREIHRTCGTRIHHQLYCPYDERVVPRNEVALGYELDKEHYVVLEPGELKKIQPPSSSVAEIIQFVKISEVDPIYFESSYQLMPEQAGKKACALLVKTMQQMQAGAIAKITIHQHEWTVLVRPYEHGLLLHTLFYPAEIHMERGFGQNKELTKQEVRLGEQLARGLLKPFRPSDFKDQYRARVEQLIESKSKGRGVPARQQTKNLAPVVDLMSALKQSLAKHPAAETKEKPRKLKKIA